MQIAPDDEIVSMVAIDPGSSLLTVCENGYGKRTALEEYRKTRRGAKGVINIRATDRNGEVVALEAVCDDDELMLITANGIMLRMDLTSVREIGRATQGVRLIRLDSNDKVVAVAKIVSEEAEEASEDSVSPDIGDSKSGGEVSQDEATE